MQGHVARGRIDLASSDLGPQGIEQSTGANDERVSVEGVLTVQAQCELTGQIHPHRHVLALPGRGKVFGELFDDVLAEKELKEPGFGDVGGQLDVIEASFAKFVDYERLVVFKGDEVHG